MKKILLILISAFCFSETYAQTAYYDALNLSKLLDATGHFKTTAPQWDSLTTILTRYLGGNVTTVTDFSNPAKSPFIAKYFATQTTTTAPIIVGHGAPLLTSGSPFDQLSLSSVGNFNVTNLADGLAQFLIERAEGEVDEAFFVKLQTFLGRYPEFATIFPNTNTFLNNFQSWQYANLLNTLREAFNKDLKQLPADLIKLRNLKESDCAAACANGSKSDCSGCKLRMDTISRFLNNTNGGLMLLSACKVADAIVQHQKIPVLIDSLVQKQYLLGIQGATAAATANIQNSLVLVKIISTSLQSNDPNQNYISNDEFNVLLTNQATRDLYLGLLYQRISKADIQINGLGIETILPPSNIEGMMNYLTNLQSNAENLAADFSLLKANKTNGKTDLSGNYAAIVQDAQQLLQALISIKMISPSITVPADLNNFVTFTTTSLQITDDILISNYSAAVMNALNLLSAAINSENYGKPTLNAFTADFLKYTSFAANVIAAKSADDVRAAIDAVALPSGSYTIKQKSDWNISFNGFVGYAFDFNQLDLNKGLYANGIYAPVGFALTHGSDKKNGWAVSLFASIVDVGSLVSYNLHSGSTDSLKQQVRLESIFSPSAQIFVEIPNTPITFGGGWRRTPKLFYTANDNVFSAVPARGVFNLSILIDIPIFTLKNWPFK